MLFLVAIPVISAFTFQLHQQVIRHRMKERLEEQLLQTITLQVKDIQWAKAEKEIWLHNRLFDIKSSSYHNGIYTFTGLYDNDETLLLTQLQKNQQQENNTGNKILLQSLQLFPITFEKSAEGLLSYLLLNRLFPEDDFTLCTGCLSIITPPPQI